MAPSRYHLKIEVRLLEKKTNAYRKDSWRQEAVNKIRDVFHKPKHLHSQRMLTLKERRWHMLSCQYLKMFLKSSWKCYAQRQALPLEAVEMIEPRQLEKFTNAYRKDSSRPESMVDICGLFHKGQDLLSERVADIKETMQYLLPVESQVATNVQMGVL